MARRGMLGAQTRVAEKLLSQVAFPVAGLVATAAPRLRHEHVDDVDKGFGPNDEGEIEPIEIRVVDPTLELIGNGCTRPPDDWPYAANGDVARERPAPIRVGARDVLKGGAARFALYVLNHLVRIELEKIDAGPTRHERQRAFGIRILAIVGE
jgi:hypothetical protein